MKQALYSIIIWGLLLTGCSQGATHKRIEPDEVIRRHIQALNEKNVKNAELYLVKDRRNIIDWQLGSQKSIHLIAIQSINNPDLITSYMKTGRGSISHPHEVKVFLVELEKEYYFNTIGLDKNIWYYYVIKQTNTSPWLIDNWGI